MLRTWLIYILMFATLLTGCNIYDTPVPEQSDDDVKITLVLSMPVDMRSRAEYDAVPFGREYYIYPSDVKVVIFNSDGTYKDNAEVLVVSQSEDSYHTYYVSCKLNDFKKEDLGKDYKVVVLANINGTYAKAGFPSVNSLKNMTEADLYASAMLVDVDPQLMTYDIINDATSGRIPMWGSKTVLFDGDYVAEIDMMRAMAKVEIELSDELYNAGHRLLSARVMNCHDNGYLVPKDAHLYAETVDTYVGSTDGIEYTGNVNQENTAVNVPGVTSLITSYFSSRNVDNNKKTLYIYIPEQPANTNFASDKILMQLIVDEESALIKEDTYTLHFAKYNSDGTKESFPVLRNHYYKYTITDVAFKHELEYRVVDWATASSTVPDFE